jgi:pimeloyl-ACP methyl ester carboxylesterase
MWNPAMLPVYRRLMLALSIAAPGIAVHADPATAVVEHRTATIDGLSIFYREAGPRDAPTIVALHGFPSSSFMYRELLPRLASRYHVIAPDYPGFGLSAFPARDRFDYSFENLTRVMERFLESRNVARYCLYIQDYGAPIGLRLALRHPERVRALIVQNGNAYAQGLSSGWDPLRAYWQRPSSDNRRKLQGWLTQEGIRQQYLAGVPEQLWPRFSPDTWTLDWALLQRPGNIELQLDLFGDYRRNVELYPQFQEMFRKHRFPLLIAWGKYDPFFTVDGARAYLRDIPDAELHLLDTGHFALETHSSEIAALILDFMQRRVDARR